MEREAAGFIPDAGLLELLLRLADPCDLRVRVYYAQDRAVVHVAVSAVDVLCGDALLLCVRIGPKVSSLMHLMFGMLVLNCRSRCARVAGSDPTSTPIFSRPWP